MLRPYAGRAKIGRPLSRPRPEVPCPNTGKPRARHEAVAGGVGGVVAVHFADVFDVALIADEQRQALDQLRAVFGDDPGVVFEQLIHPLPAPDAVVIGGRGAGPAARAAGTAPTPPAGGVPWRGRPTA